MDFNFFVIPIIVIVVAYYGDKYVKGGKEWFSHLHKPKLPNAELFSPAQTMVYILTAIGVLWFWNIPAFTYWHFIVGALLLASGGLNLYLTRLFFMNHDIQGTYKKLLVLLGIIVFVLIMLWFISQIALVLLLPYAAWIAAAAHYCKEIAEKNKKSPA